MSEGANSVAIGFGAYTEKSDSVAIGRSAYAVGPTSIALGTISTATQENSTALGYSTMVKGYSSTAVGSLVAVTGDFSGAFGYSNSYMTPAVTGTASYSFGAMNQISGNKSVALGDFNNIQTNHTYALGDNITNTIDDSVFLGSYARYVAEGATTAGISKAYTGATINGMNYQYAGGDITTGVVSVGSTKDTRRVQNMAPGPISDTSTDAINGSQLYATNSVLGNLANTTALGIGGGTTVNPDGTLKVALTVAGNTYNNVQDALNAIPISTGGGSTTAINPNGIYYDDANKNSVTLAGPNGTTISNVAPGRVAPDSMDAINGGQLYNTSRALTRDINNSGALGAALAGLHPIQYDPQDRNQIMAAVGHYKNSNALALGWAHYTNEDTMIHAGVALGSGEHMFNFGATWKWGEDKQPKGVAKIYGGDPISSVYTLERQMIAKDQEIGYLKDKTQRLEQETADLHAKTKKLEEQVNQLLANR